MVEQGIAGYFDRKIKYQPITDMRVSPQSASCWTAPPKIDPAIQLELW
jgi:hypothetical protein